MHDPTAHGYLDVDRAVDSIRVGRRYREDLGDLDALAHSIAQLGLLQPITVTPDGLLVCGLRRLAALKRLGIRTTRVWVRTGISEDVQQLLAEKDDNGLHKPLSVIEAAALYRQVKALLEEDAARRKASTQFSTAKQPSHDLEPGTGTGTGTGTGDGPGNLPAPSGERATSRHQAAVMTTGNASYKRLEAVGALERIRDDQLQRPQIRKHAAEALEKIADGAPVLPLYELIKAEIASNVYAASRRTNDSSDTGTTTAPVSPGSGPNGGGEPAPRRGTIRGFLLTISSLDGWADSFDADQIGRGLSEQEWATFERVLDSLARFAVVARAGREAADAHRVRG